MKILCRICKVQQGEFFTLDSLVFIYGEREHTLLEMYNKCFQLNAILQDSLPQVICLVCFEKLKDFFEFQLQAEKSDLELRENHEENYLLEEQSTDTEKDEFADNCDNVLNSDPSNTEVVIKKEIENITTEDEDVEGSYEVHETNDDELNEDTDILFELYSKNDSCMEKYWKFEKTESNEIMGDENVDKVNNDEIELASAENTKSSDEFDPKIKSLDLIIPSVEISRVQPTNAQIQTIVLEPLVEKRKWQCPDCGRKYLREEKLEKHQKLHKQSENCRCEICGCILETLYDYGIHIKTHCPERKFSCEFCDKSCSTRASLKAHLYIHSNLRPYKCEICNKSFQQKSILKTHMTLHTGKPFECTLCQRRFSRTAHLNIHMRQHNNIRPYKCSQCQCSYMQKSHLDRHISSSHLGVRYQCTVCGKMYTKKPSLNIHMREAHCATVSLYSCEICDLDFSKQKGLYYHMKSKHPDYKQ